MFVCFYCSFVIEVPTSNLGEIGKLWISKNIYIYQAVRSFHWAPIKSMEHVGQTMSDFFSSRFRIWRNSSCVQQYFLSGRFIKWKVKVLMLSHIKAAWAAMGCFTFLSGGQLAASTSSCLLYVAIRFFGSEIWNRFILGICYAVSAVFLFETWQCNAFPSGGRWILLENWISWSSVSIVWEVAATDIGIDSNRSSKSFWSFLGYINISEHADNQPPGQLLGSRPLRRSHGVRI